MEKQKASRYSPEKANAPFAKRLRELISNEEISNDLKDHLGVSPQAFSQYKNGITYPKTENLVKIASYFNVSLDYLFALSDVKTPDTNLRSVCDYTGLSESAIKALRAFLPDERETLNAVLSSSQFRIIVDKIRRNAMAPDDQGKLIIEYIKSGLSGNNSTLIEAIRPYIGEDFNGLFRNSAIQALNDLFDEMKERGAHIATKEQP